MSTSHAAEEAWTRYVRAYYDFLDARRQLMAGDSAEAIGRALTGGSEPDRDAALRLLGFLPRGRRQELVRDILGAVPLTADEAERLISLPDRTGRDRAADG